jgi:hypothetical protein
VNFEINYESSRAIFFSFLKKNIAVRVTVCVNTVKVAPYLENLKSCFLVLVSWNLLEMLTVDLKFRTDGAFLSLDSR